MSKRGKTGRTKSAGKARPVKAGDADSRGWRIAFLVLCTVGACLSADLLRLHVNVHTDPDYHSYCAMSERVNCDTVAASGYAVFLGLPMALWGLVGYVGTGALSVWGLRRTRYGDTWPLGLMFWLAAAFSALAVALYLLSHLVVESVCVVCAATYLVNFGLAYVAFMALRRVGCGASSALRDDLRAVAATPGPFALFSGTLSVVMVTIWIVVPPYWRIEASTGPGGLPVGETADGHPWIGATEPVLEIEEFSDYQCPHCRRGHDDIRKLIEEHADRVRLVHRHYPLDQHCNPALNRPFHPHACRYARLAVCAQDQGMFWEANDYLFANGRRRSPVTVGDLAAGIGLDTEKLRSCVEGERAGRVVQRDLESGRVLRVRGTPTFVVRGEIYPGRVPPEVVRALAPMPGPPDG
jgi:uncharacterized membrane protein/predicted DsbA family dithiol-disulfide isomerase